MGTFKYYVMQWDVGGGVPISIIKVYDPMIFNVRVRVSHF